MAAPTSAFTVTGSSSGSSNQGTVTEVTGAAGQIAVTSPTSTPVISLDPAFLAEITNLQDAVQNAGSANASPNPNFLINGEGILCQRGVTGSASFNLPTAITRYVDDMWQIQTQGTPVTVSQVAGPNGAPGSAIQIQRTANSTAVNPVQYGQTLMPRTATRLWGKFATFAFDAQALANYTGTLTAVIMGGTTSNPVSYLGTGFTNPQTLATLDVPLTTAWTTFEVSVTAEITNASTQLYVGFIWTPAGQAGAQDGFVVTRRSLNEGVAATPYNSKDFLEYLDECLPFYQKSYDLKTPIGTNTGAGAVTVASVGLGTPTYVPGYANLIFAKPMVFTPSVALYDYSGAASNLSLSAVSTKGMTLSNYGYDFSPTDGGGGTFSGKTYSSHFVLDASPV